MTSRINATPKGLQDLFGNTAAGINPSELELQVRPTIDLLPYWLVDRAEYTHFTGSLAAVYQQQTIRVPRGEMWIPLVITGEAATTIIGELIQIVVGTSDATNNRRMHRALSDSTLAVTPSESSIATYTWDQIECIPADEYFYIESKIFKADGARTVVLNLKFIRIRV